MSNLWARIKAAWPNLLWMLAGLVLLVNPSHIDSFISAHPKWSGILLAVWTALLTWAQKLRYGSGTYPPPEPTTPYPPGTGANPNPTGAARGAPPGQKPNIGGLR